MNTRKSRNFFGCLIKSDLEDKTLSSETEIMELLSMITPQLSGHELLRIGKARDGSYLLPDDLQDVAACFSPGVNNFKEFEDCLVNRYDIECHMCDASSDIESFQTAIIHGKQTFRKLWLDVSKASDSISIESWIKEVGADDKGDLILQMDIEGAEYRNILNTNDSVLEKFRIMVIEFHGLDRILDDEVRSQVILPVFRKLNRMFQVVHAHPNNYDGEFKVQGTQIHLSKFLEITLHRRDRISINYNVNNGYAMIPHPLDITNVRSRPPIFLDRGLLPSKRSWRSRIKIFSEWFYYITWAIARKIRDFIREFRHD